MGPLLTLKVHEALRDAARSGVPAVECSLDLERSTTTVEPDVAGWTWQGQRFPWLDSCKDRTIYHWDGEAFQVAARFTTSLIKLVPTQWGPPTFEIDGIKMLPTAQVSPYVDAERKVGLIQPRGKVVLDTCGGLGYFAAWCLLGQAKQVLSYEKNPDVIWLRSLNPWSPGTGSGLTLNQATLPRESPCCPAGRSMRFCTIRRASVSPENSIRRSSMITWPGCSGAKANCFITPAHRTNSPADAMCLLKCRNVCGMPGLSRS